MDKFLRGALLVALLASGKAYAGPKMEIGGDTNCWMQVGVLGQPHFLYTRNGADQEDFYLRRGRVILTGQVMDGVKLFVDTDAANTGKNGVPTSHVDIQDAFLDIRVCKTELGEQWVKAGYILLPFSLENRSGAGSLLGVDYNSEVMKLVNTFAWRDSGVELHGNLGDRFSYAVGTFDGYDSAEGTKNPASSLRLTSHVSYNLLGKAEADWFFSQERLGKGSPYVSIGTGYDHQDEASLTYSTPAGSTNKTTSITDSSAWVLDFQSGCKAGPVDLTLNGGWYEWDNVTYKGSTACLEGGARVDKNQMTMKYSIQDPDAKDKTEDYTVGLNHFLKGHNTRGGVEYRWGDSPTTVLVGLQFLL